METKAVLSDLDGCLVRAKEIHYEALNEALRDIAGCEISRADHLKTFNGLPTKTKLNILAKDGRVDPKDFDAIYKAKQDKTWEVVPRIIRPDKNIIDLSRYWKEQGYKFACVTNAINHSAHLMLKACGALPYVDAVVSNEHVEVPKPEPEGYWTAMKILGVHPGECVIIEDSHKGFKSALRTGCTNIWYVSDVDELTIANFKQFMER